MFWSDKTQVFGNSDYTQRHQLRLLAYFATIAAITWLLIAVYYWADGSYRISMVCLFASLASATALFACLYRPSIHHIVVHVFIFGNVMSLCGTSAVSWGTHSQDVLYYPIIVFITAQLVGYRWALVWSLPIIVFSVLTYFQNMALGGLPEVHLDRLIHSIGAITTALWISFETARFSRLRKRHLVKITEKLQEKTHQLELAEETAGVGHWHWNAIDNNVSLSNEAHAICALGNSDSESAISLTTFVDVWDPRHHAPLSKLLAKIDKGSLSTDFRIDLSYETQDGIRHVSCRGIYERDVEQNIAGIFGTLRDDTELRLVSDRLTVKADELNQLVSYDPLTGLANRFQFQQALDKQLLIAEADQRQIALLVLDMDGFKEINDSLGHTTGDRVLKVVAERLKRIVRQSDLVARLGGDEFTVIIGKMTDESEVLEIAHRIVSSVANPIVIDELVLNVGISVGGSIYPRDSQSSVELFAFSDTAMYKAKANNCGVAMYSMEMTEELLSRRLTEDRLRGALERGEFHLLYQPQADIRSGEISGFECLIRWQGDGESMLPVEFIPLLESSGKIIDVGRWVLDQACQQVAQWQAQGFELTMAVNISPVQFRESCFVERTIEIVQKHEIDPTLIKIEITEGLLIHDLEDARRKLFELKNHGMKISVDDFGTGYSSLAYLKDLPIDQLKIDRAFIKDIPESDDGTIASSIILLGQSLGLEVLAEGVETQDQLEFLKVHDCHSYQGYLLGRPMTVENGAEVLKQASSF